MVKTLFFENTKVDSVFLKLLVAFPNKLAISSLEKAKFIVVDERKRLR